VRHRFRPITTIDPVKPRDARRQKQRDYERGQVKRAADMHGLITCMDVFKPKSLRVPIN
jgi:hypothetical protein